MPTHSSCRLLLPAALLCAAPLAAAAEEGTRPPALVEEIEVKGRRPTRSESLEVREVRETPARDLGEALAAEANLAKVRKAGTASDVVLRGLKRDDIAVLVDGQQLHGACPSRMDPPSFHLDYAEVDRVEIRKGPFDVTHPGGLGGLVDVRTRSARRGLGTEVNLGAGSFGAWEGSGVVSYAGERADVLAGGAWKTGQPFASGDGRNFTLAVPATLAGQPNGGRYRDTRSGQTAYDVRSGWVKAGLAPASGQRLELSYTRQSADDVLYPYLLMDGLRDDTDRASAQYTLEELGPVARAQALLYWNRVEHDMTDAERCSSAASPVTCAGALPREYGMRTLARSSVLGGKLEAAFEGPGRPLRWLAGADFYLRNWNNVTTRAMRTAPGIPYAEEASIPDVTIADVGLYAQARHPFGPVWLTAGARLDLARARAAVDRTALYAQFHPEVGTSRQRTDLLPGANLQADWEVAPGTSLFAGFGHAVRAPDQQERFFALTGMGGRPAWVGNPDLRPVRNDELDLGVKHAAGGLLLKATAFHGWLGDYVTLAPATAGTATARTYRNVDARIFGGEASASVPLPFHLYAGASLAYTRGQRASGGSLAEIPPLKSALSLRYDREWIFAEVEEVMAARQGQVDAALLEQPTGAWAITNVKLGIDRWGLRLFGGVRNLLDKTYTEHLSYQRDPFASGIKVPEPGRTLYLNAQYRM